MMQGGSIASVEGIVVSVVSSTRRCASQAVSGAAVVQEEETSTGAGARVMRVGTLEAGQKNMFSSADFKGRGSLAKNKTMIEAVLCTEESGLSW